MTVDRNVNKTEQVTAGLLTASVFGVTGHSLKSQKFAHFLDAATIDFPIENP